MAVTDWAEVDARVSTALHEVEVALDSVGPTAYQTLNQLRRVRAILNGEKHFAHEQARRKRAKD